jgi:hypothetical protein
VYTNNNIIYSFYSTLYPTHGTDLILSLHTLEQNRRIGTDEGRGQMPVLHCKLDARVEVYVGSRDLCVKWRGQT